MPLFLGIDGKRRALNINKGETVPPLATLYVGLLQKEVLNMDGMDLATLIQEVNGDEFPINADFYTGRKEIEIGFTSADETGAQASNSNLTPIEWVNDTGIEIEVAGFFITDVISGGAGNVIWVGSPDAGTATIVDGSSALISIGDLIIRVD